METESRQTEDAIKLLKECDSGTKMAVESMEEVIDKIRDHMLRRSLEDSVVKHKHLGDEIHEQLLQLGEEDKEPNPIAKGMSWMKTNVKLTMNESDKTVADLMTGGCDMGIKSLHRYMNQYECAHEKAKNLCERLIEEEEN